MLKTIIVATNVMLLFMLSIAHAQNLPVNPQFTEHVNILNELYERRRVNTFFPNEQSVFYGLQSGFVNVGKGNLTFARRDLVTAGRMPIVIARVYDSSLTDTTDFSSGWQLSLAESIDIKADGTLLYRDDSAVLNQFIPATVGYKINPAQNSDIKSVAFNSQGLIQLTYLTGWTKQFQKLGDKYRLVTINDNNGNQLTLSYVENRLASIHGAHHVAINRDETGRIINVTDDNNRTINYHYDEKNQLTGVSDLAHNFWQYHYTATGLLKKVVDPLTQLAAKFSFNQNHKVKKVKIRTEKFSYQYKGNQTQVTDENDNTSTFVQNPQGITTSITNAEGFTSAIVLNERNQITELWHNGQQQAHITYDDNGRPSRYDINGKPTALETLKQNNYQQYHYQYDDEGRVIAIDGNDETHISYEYDEKGNLTRGPNHRYRYAANGDVLNETDTSTGQTKTFSYHPDGLLATLSENQLTSHFTYTKLGKLNKITFPNGASHQYQYDLLGFRTATKRSDKSRLGYVYDSLGNLRTSTATAPDKQTSNEILTLNANNQLTKIQTTGEDPLIIKYTGKGNPKTITQGNHTVKYQYDKSGRLTGVDDNINGELNYDYQKDQADIRRQLDDRTAKTSSIQSKISGHNQTQSQLFYTRLSGSPWQAVIWDSALAKFLVPSPAILNSPDAGYQSSQQRRRLYNAITVTQALQYDFDKPSNSFFLPPEYEAINCLQGCTIVLVLLNMPPTGTVGKPVTFLASVVEVVDQCEMLYYLVTEGGTTGIPSTTGIFTHTYDSPGFKEVEILARCKDCFSLKKRTKTIEIKAPPTPPPTPTGVTINTSTTPIWTINENVTMPNITLEATAAPSNLPLAGLTYHWFLTIDHTQSKRTSAPVRIPATSTINITGSNKWKPAWGQTIAGGNNVTVNVSVSNASGSTPVVTKSGYKIHGTNPTAAQIRTDAGTNPWFLPRLIQAESTNRQFSPSPGEPINNGNGFGLMQVDNPPPTDRALWDWRLNIDEGRRILNVKRLGFVNGTDQFWARQVSQYNRFILDGNFAPPPADIAINDIVFSYTPTGDQKPMSDGLWIKAYNGASGGHWVTWLSTHPAHWQHNPLNNLGHDYVQLVVQQTTQQVP